mgnify:CR=1 FL=1
MSRHWKPDTNGKIQKLPTGDTRRREHLGSRGAEQSKHCIDHAGVYVPSIEDTEQGLRRGLTESIHLAFLSERQWRKCLECSPLLRSLLLLLDNPFAASLKGKDVLSVDLDNCFAELLLGLFVILLLLPDKTPSSVCSASLGRAFLL